MLRGLPTRESLARRIDRCYLVAAGTRLTDKRSHYIALARHYRGVLAAESAQRPQPASGNLRPA
jgi:hypothetical protein